MFIERKADLVLVYPAQLTGSAVSVWQSLLEDGSLELSVDAIEFISETDEEEDIHQRVGRFLSSDLDTEMPLEQFVTELPVALPTQSWHLAVLLASQPYGREGLILEDQQTTFLLEDGCHFEIRPLRRKGRVVRHGHVRKPGEKTRYPEYTRFVVNAA